MIGADVTKISRIREAVQSERFIERVFTKNEVEYARSKKDFAQTLAGIYAAKEAVAKLGGKGVRGFWLSDIEVVHTDLGAPQVIFHGKAKALFDKAYISISHDGDYAFAVASVSDCQVKPLIVGKMIADDDIKQLDRQRFTHKGDYGRVYVIGGSYNMVGAPLITAEAAVRAGAGLTTLCVAGGMMRAYQYRVKEIMLKPIGKGENITFDKNAFDEIIQKADVVAIGMGMGANDSILQILEHVFNNFDGIVVCDADGINALCKNVGLLTSQRKCKLVLTPHVGEFERLQKATDIVDVQEMALKTSSVIALKSAYTVVSDGIKSYSITSGCAAMAKGGSGDALAGIISAYACRTTLVDAVALACHYFGRCGEKAAQIKGENAVTASDIIDCL